MVSLEQIARLALAHHGIELRSAVQDRLADQSSFASEPPPSSDDPDVLAVAAGLGELLARRLCVLPPHWARSAGPATRDLYLVQSAMQMPRLRRLCEESGPIELRKRRIYAPPDFLTFA